MHIFTTSPVSPPMRHSGFTLLELLVALALMGLIAALLYVAFSVGVGQWSRTEMRFTRLETALAGRQALRQLIGAAYPRYEAIAAGQGAVAFTGSAERLTFLTPLPASLGHSELAEMTLAAAGPMGARYLMLDWSRQGSTSPHQTPILAETIAAVEFAYFGQASGEPKPIWHASWIGESHLPQLVRIRVKSTKSPSDQEAEWIVRPGIDVDVSCVYDFISRACHGRA